MVCIFGGNSAPPVHWWTPWVQSSRLELNAPQQVEKQHSAQRGRRIRQAFAVARFKKKHWRNNFQLHNMVKLAFNSALGQKDFKKEEKDEALIPQDVVSFISTNANRLTLF